MFIVGQKITNQVSEKLKRYTKKIDRVQIGDDKVTHHDLNNLVYGTIDVKEKHLPYLEKLKQRAIENSSISMRDYEFLTNENAL